MELSNQTVLITGASRGLGAALATTFAKEGQMSLLTIIKARKRQKTSSKA